MRKIDTRNFQRATRTTPREINRRIVLNLIREHQPISRADLARRMGVRRGMLTSLVGELIGGGWVYEGATGSAPRGRRPTLLHVRTRDRLAVAVDVRFSRTQVMLGDFGGRELALETFATPESPGRLVAALTERVRRLLAVHAGMGSCEGVGLVVPGMVERGTGRILSAPALGWRDVDLRDALATSLALPVHIERDAVGCALAQLWLGRHDGQRLDSFLYVTVSDAVGAGLVANGQVVRGNRDAAGEFGHIPLDFEGPACLCGARGCWEAYTSNPATIARYFDLELSTLEQHVELRERGFTVTDLIARARSGDAAARAALKATGRFLGIGLASIINAVNPARVIVGGEVAAAWDILEPPVRAAVVERTLTGIAARTPIHPEPSNENARLRGATALVVAPAFAAPEVA